MIDNVRDRLTFSVVRGGLCVKKKNRQVKKEDFEVLEVLRVVLIPTYSTE